MFLGFNKNTLEIEDKDIENNIEREKYMNHGNYWTPEENKQLFEEIEKKIPYSNIALIHKRSIGGIRSRVLHLSYEMYIKKQKTIDELVDFTGIDKSSFERSFSIRDKNIDNEQ